MPVAILSTKDNYETSGTTIKYDNVVYAIDINWNGAKPGIGENQTTGITIIGELLSSIKEVYSPMFAN